MTFIDEVARLFQKHAPAYGIKCVSVPTAQFIKESGMGTSELAIKAKNFAGIKLKYTSSGECRTPIAIGGYDKASGEYYSGEYTTKVSTFAAFRSLEDCVIGYLQFITSSSAYNGLQGLTDAKKYCELIKIYATGPTYSESLWKDFVVKYNLTQYDNFDSTVPSEAPADKMVINVHAGHNPDGKVACGAVGIIKESTYNRLVKDKVIEYLEKQGHTVYDCTCDDGTSVTDVLNKIVAKCNAHTADVDVSIHFNAGGGRGTEVLVYSTTSKSNTYAQKILDSICELGFVKRGVKVRNELTVLKKTKAPALLVECCFVDSKEDTDRLNVEAMAKAIVKGITGEAVVEDTPIEEPKEEEKPFVLCPHCGEKVYI